ncbi:MAG: hypothetical protein IJ086_10285 [Clostridium sp.]|nr:hypothetical protein [Clostridium sp.]
MKGLKKIMSIGEILFVKDIKVESKQPKEYIVDTFDNISYICYSDKKTPMSILDEVQLKEMIEADNKNTYIFTKEAYSRCEEYYKKLRIVVA